MSTNEIDDWSVDETVTLIGIIKSLKELNGAGKVDWQHVASEMAESKTSSNGHKRSLLELRERFDNLKNSYFTARNRNGSCQYYNYLKDLLLEEPEIEHEQELELEPEPVTDEEDIKVEPKYSQTNKLNMEFNGVSKQRSSKLMGRNCKWAAGEVEALLNIIITHKLQAPLLSKRNAKVFKVLAREMAKRGFVKRPEQLRLKYHHLRREYAKAKNSGESFEHFEDMHALLNGSQKIAKSDAEEGEIDSNDSDEEDGDMAMESDNESKGVLITTASRNVRVKWADGEVDVFLDIIRSLGLQSALLRKRNAKFFKVLSKEMAKKSFDKAPEKLRIKFQYLRTQYNKAKKTGESFEHFEAMHQLLNPVKKPGEDTDVNNSSDSESDYLYSDESEGNNSRRRHPDTYYWTDHEVDVFLDIIKEQNLFRALDGSKKRNFKTLAYISTLLAKQSYQRTPHQLRNKLRLLLNRYRDVKRDGPKNVRMLPRHFNVLDDLITKKQTTSTAKPVQPATASTLDESTKSEPLLESDSDASSSASSCDLLRVAGVNSDNEDTSEMPPEPTPLELMTSINESQKQLLSTLSDFEERLLRQQREMQAQFLQQVTSVMRLEREATVRMVKDLMMQAK